MDKAIPTSPAFRADPRGWVTRMIDRLMAPGVVLAERDRAWVIGKRAHFAKRPDLVPGPHAYERICRIAQSCGVLRPRPQARASAAPSAVSRPVRATPPQFAPGAAIPGPPPLRRPVALLERPETWDPAGMPGL